MEHGGSTAPTASAEVPQQRTGEPPSRSAEVLRGLGLDALVDLVEGSAYGIVVTGEDHRWVYLNPAGCRFVGRPFEELEGEDYLLTFPEHEREALLALEQDQRAGDTAWYANTVVRPDGSPLAITWSGTVVEAGGQELAPAVFHPTHALGRAEREAAALGAAASRIAAGGTARELLAGLAQEAVAGSRAVACAVLVEDDDGVLDVAAEDGLPGDALAAVRDARLRLADLPGGELLAAGRVLLLSDDRDRLRATPATQELERRTAGLSWRGTAKVPLHRGGQVIGCLVLLLPADVTAPTEGELTAWSALGAHASAALADERLHAQAAAHAAELERRRLGRDLHDAVSAAVFSLHVRAQVVTRALSRGDAELAATAAEDMEALSRQAIAELRTMVGQMRDEPGRSSEELVASLQALAATTTARDGLPVQVVAGGPARTLPARTVDHLLRIAGEALHNAVKHAGAAGAVLRLEVRDGDLLLAVSDDGAGFDPAAVPPGRHGQRTMRERAALCDGTVDVDSAPGTGTRVTVRVPLTG